MKRTVLKLDLHDDEDKRKALKAVSTLSGVDSISIDMKDRKLTVVGDADPIDIVKKLRKCWKVEIFTVGVPPKEGGGGGGGGKEGGSAGGEKKKPSTEQMAEFHKLYQGYPNPPQYYYYPNYYPSSVEENPSNCVIT